jgi:ribonuclease T1
MKHFLLVLLLGLAGSLTALAAEPASVPTGELPREARVTLRLIEQGGPFPYRRDGVVFGNREQRLPPKPRGAYREYTVPTPGASGRGARRIVAAESGERYYTANHYRSFRRIRE